ISTYAESREASMSHECWLCVSQSRTELFTELRRVLFTSTLLRVFLCVALWDCPSNLPGLSRLSGTLSKRRGKKENSFWEAYYCWCGYLSVHDSYSGFQPALRIKGERYAYVRRSGTEANKLDITAFQAGHGLQFPTRRNVASASAGGYE
ncbi:hypothetical protein, partial [Paludibacter sp. 221]|uniref:hypothetical protein n=1 Tax=Paludibacter sp. 221 TaxID=2302939 RepID=UPI0019447B24